MELFADLSARLSHVYWIGGGSGAGKSTIAGHLARAHGLELYSTDAAMGDHFSRLTAAEAPALASFAAMSMDERWIRRSPECMLDAFHWFRGEGFELVLEDLAAIPSDRPVVAEGFRLLPSLVTQVLRNRHQAVWLVPTPRFRRSAFNARGTTWDIPNRTSDPERALRHLLDRDALFTDRLAAQTRRLDLPVVHVDAGSTEKELTGRLTSMFRL